jgi:hypothetical protein
MLNHPFEIKKNLSKNNVTRISLIPEKQDDNKSNDNISLIVMLGISYHLESFEFSMHVPTKNNEKTKEKEFNMFDILERIFSDFIKQNKNTVYILSYSMDSSTDIKDETNIKTYNYLGELNSEFFSKKKYIYYAIPKDNIVYLKLRQKIKRENSFEPSIFEDNDNKFSNKIFQCINLDEEEDEKKKKRNGRDKEKTIAYAIIKVFKWEKIREKGGNNITLEDAAKCIGMAKKTLDDYKKQIKAGKDNNFNFNKYYKFKMNILKDFNEKKKLKK